MPLKDPEKRREYQRNWHAANREKSRETSRKWREANPVKVLESTRKWREANREKLRESQRRYWAAKRAKAEKPSDDRVTDGDEDWPTGDMLGGLGQFLSRALTLALAPSPLSRQTDDGLGPSCRRQARQGAPEEAFSREAPTGKCTHGLRRRRTSRPRLGRRPRKCSIGSLKRGLVMGCRLHPPS
jgi:hypothetical protein